MKSGNTKKDTKKQTETKQIPAKVQPVQKKRRKKVVRVQSKIVFTSADQISRLELYEQEDQNNPLNQQFKPLANFSGPKTQRNRTDSICILLYFILFLILIVQTIYVIQYGDYHKIYSGMDFRTEVCGLGGLNNLPYKYYLEPTNDLNVAMCVQQCPQTTGEQICLYKTDHKTQTTFCYIQLSSKQIGTICEPQEPISRSSVDSLNSNIQNIIKRIFSDLWLSIDLIIISLILISFASYLLSYMLSKSNIIRYEVWISIWGTIICLLILAIIFDLEKNRIVKQRCLFNQEKHYCGGFRASFFQTLSIITFILSFLYFIFITQIFNKINLAIGLIKAASRVVDVLQQLRFFAIFISIFGLAFLFICFVCVVYGLTLGDVQVVLSNYINGGIVKQFTINQQFRLTLIYPAFMVLFTMIFYLHLNEMFNCYALSVWFFTKEKDAVNIPLRQVFKELFLHHLGSCIMLTILEIFFIIPKLLMQIIHSALRELPQNSQIVRFIQGSCLCCLCFHQNFLRYISKHGSVQVAVWSEQYIISQKKAFFLLLRNNKHTNNKELDFLVEFILMQIKICISLVFSLPIYIYLNLMNKTPFGNLISIIETPIVPTLFVFVFGFYFSTAFFGTYDICAKSVIQLYLIDKEMFYAEQRYTEKFIQDFMDFFGKSEADKIFLKAKKMVKYTAKIAPEDRIVQDDEEAQVKDEILYEEDDYDDDIFQVIDNNDMDVKPNRREQMNDPFEIQSNAKSEKSDIDMEEADVFFRSRSNLRAPKEQFNIQNLIKIKPQLQQENISMGQNYSISTMLKK